MTRAASGKPMTGTFGAAAPTRRVATSYLDRSSLPLTSLLFVVPLLILYEIGTRLWAFDPATQTEQRIIAFSKIQEFFRIFGVSGQFMPALAVVGILLAWHIARNDSWNASGSTLMWMVVESFALALPLAAIGYVFAHYLPLHTGAGANWPALFVLSIGAGIYEELMFRLILVIALHLLLVDLFGMRGFLAGLLIVCASSISFSAYHYLGSETFHWPSFAFRTVAGIYFTSVFLWRGFGITVGSHASYDIVIHAVQLLRVV